MRCERCGCTLFSCQCPHGSVNPLVEAIPDNCLPFSGDVGKLSDFLAGPKMGADGKIISDGVWTGMTIDEVLADRDAYNRAAGGDGRMW